MSRLRTTVVALVALAGLAACGADEGAGSADDTSTPSSSASDDSSAASSTASGTLALTADGATAGKCAVPSAETLATFDTAFAGTVTSLDDGTATLAVDQWYVGDEAATVTVTSPSKDLQELLMAVDFQQGRSYLVSASGDRVTLCGFTAEESPELQALYDAAFAQ
ncbi:hypothetical protein [Nocardioides sp.]|uniref:hypothetical protein n=1 Tax=Nocardioides sp. TaxID=35761 RepID=UPI00262A1D59|nr:hypothetical protein [Nocardioides sp.]MCW2735961.1 hypothetical protein [Nocardioides sp.]